MAVSLEELLSVLQKSGAPVNGSSFDMGQFQPFAKSQIASQVQPDYSPLQKYKNEYKTKLSQIAAMDQKLAGVYSNPSSNLYIENPMSRDSAIYGRRPAENARLETIANTADRERSRIDTKTEQKRSEAQSLLSSLATAKGKQEAEIRRIEREQERETKKKAKGSGTTQVQGFGKLTPTEKRQLGQVGIDPSDLRAVSEFFNKTSPKFRDYIADEVIDGKVKGKVDAKRIKELNEKFEKENIKKSVEKSKEKKKIEDKKRKSLF